MALNDIKGKVLIIGAGKSGISSAGLLKRQGIDFGVFDGADDITVKDVRDKNEVFKDADVYVGDITPEQLSSYELAVVSPGIPMMNSAVEKCREAGLSVIGEIELGYIFSKGKIVAITGTNGKTTTTTLTGEIIKRYAKDVYVAGNIGDPYTDIADKTTDESVCVLEISSFQLETVQRFSADISAVLNVTPDHLDRHGSMEVYAAMKERIAKGERASDVCILNADNSYCADFTSRCPAKPVLFSSSKELKDGYYLKDDIIYESVSGDSRKLISMDEVSLVGTCNAENIMAAIALTKALGVPEDIILDTVRGFKAVPHRIEFAGEKRGVKYYNDSKATNPDSAIQGIKAMKGPTYLIAGGYDKNASYDEWINAFDGKVKELVLIGQTARKIAECARNNGFDKITLADGFEEAFRICEGSAKPGENVLLSPACASWGMFNNFEERGDLFKKMAGEIT